MSDTYSASIQDLIDDLYEYLQKRSTPMQRITKALDRDVLIPWRDDKLDTPARQRKAAYTLHRYYMASCQFRSVLEMLSYLVPLVEDNIVNYQDIMDSVNERLDKLNYVLRNITHLSEGLAELEKHHFGNTDPFNNT